MTEVQDMEHWSEILAERPDCSFVFHDDQDRKAWAFKLVAMNGGEADPRAVALARFSQLDQVLCYVIGERVPKGRMELWTNEEIETTLRELGIKSG